MLTPVLEYVVKHLVNQPEQVVITQHDNGHKIIVDIQVAPDDLKRLIGKEGRVIRALRVLVNSLEGQADKEVVLNAVSSSPQ